MRDNFWRDLCGHVRRNCYLIVPKVERTNTSFHFSKHELLATNNIVYINQIEYIISDHRGDVEGHIMLDSIVLYIIYIIYII